MKWRKWCFWHNIYCLRLLGNVISFKKCFFNQDNRHHEKVQRSDFNWGLLWYNQICSLLSPFVQSLFFFLPLPFCLTGQSVVRRQHEAKLTLDCRVCYHDDAEEIPDLVHPTWHDLQLFVSAVFLLMGTLVRALCTFAASLCGDNLCCLHHCVLLKWAACSHCLPEC